MVLFLGTLPEVIQEVEGQLNTLLTICYVHLLKLEGTFCKASGVIWMVVWNASEHLDYSMVAFADGIACLRIQPLQTRGNGSHRFAIDNALCVMLAESNVCLA